METSFRCNHITQWEIQFLVERAFTAGQLADGDYLEYNEEAGAAPATGNSTSVNLEDGSCDTSEQTTKQQSSPCSVCGARLSPPPAGLSTDKQRDWYFARAKELTSDEAIAKLKQLSQHQSRVAAFDLDFGGKGFLQCLPADVMHAFKLGIVKNVMLHQCYQCSQQYYQCS